MRAVRSLLFVVLVSSLPVTAGPRASSLFAAAPTPIYAVPGADAREIGKLLAAARIVPLARDADGWQRIEVTGWTQAGAERVLQAAPGIRVTQAALAKTGLDALRFGEVRKDPDTGQIWTRTTLSGWLAPDAATAPDLDTLWVRADRLFGTRCIACHERRVPERYTANQWTSYLKVMGPRTGLPKDDQALIRVYLQYRSADADALAAALAED